MRGRGGGGSGGGAAPFNRGGRGGRGKKLLFILLAKEILNVVCLLFCVCRIPQ